MRKILISAFILSLLCLGYYFLIYSSQINNDQAQKNNINEVNLQESVNASPDSLRVDVYFTVPRAEILNTDPVLLFFKKMEDEESVVEYNMSDCGESERGDSGPSCLEYNAKGLNLDKMSNDALEDDSIYVGKVEYLKVSNSDFGTLKEIVEYLKQLKSQ